MATSLRPIRRAMRLNPPPRRLRAGLAQLLFAAAGAAGGIAAAQINAGPTMPTGRAVELLGAVGFGVLGVASIVFSLLFLVVQWADSHLTPRLTLFRNDPIVWRAFASAVGIFTFCIVTILALGGRDTTSRIIPFIGLLLVLIALTLIRALQTRAFASIQLAPALDAVTVRGEEILRILHDADDHIERVDPGPATATITWPHGICVLQYLDIRGLVTAATGSDTVIVMRQPVGAALRTGVPIASIHGGRHVPAETVLSKLVVGAQPTFGQDPQLALRIVADIGLRALSTAVNDPATAVQALDHIHQLLGDIAGHPHHNGTVADDTGTPRLQLQLPTWDDYLTTALADIIATDTHSPMVTDRLTALIDDISTRVEPSDRVRLDHWRTTLNDRAAA